MSISLLKAEQRPPESKVREVELGVTAKQRQFLEALLLNENINQIGFGGRRGAGKTAVGCLGVTLRALYYKNTEHLCIRRVQLSSDLNLGREFRKTFRRLGLPIGLKRRGEIQWHTRDRIFEFPNGSIIQLGFCLREDDWERYQGRECATVWFSEATQFPEIAFRLIGGSNRSVENPDCPGKKIVDFNPGGQGHEWCKRVFANPRTRERRTLWIPAGIRDSHAVLEHDPGYVLRTLRNIPEWLRRQWEDGDMDAVAGEFWVINPEMIVDVKPPREADWYGGVDYGFAKPFAVVFVARWKEWYSEIDANGFMNWKFKERAHVYREIYQAGLHLDEQAQLVLDTEKTLPLNGKSVLYYGDPSTGKETEHAATEVGRSIRDAWAMYGLYVQPSISNARVPGWNLMKLLNKQGVHTISPECVCLLAELRSHVAEGSPGPPTGEDIQQGNYVNDHLADGWRYETLSTFGLGYGVTGHSAYDQPGDYPEE